MIKVPRVKTARELLGNLGGVKRLPKLSAKVKVMAEGGEVEEEMPEPSAGRGSRARNVFESAGMGSSKSMGMALGSLGEMKGEKGRRGGGDTARAQLDDVLRQLKIRERGVQNMAKGLARDTFGAPTLEGPTLTKSALTRRSFAEGGDVSRETSDSRTYLEELEARDDPIRSGRPLQQRTRRPATLEENQAMSRAVAQGVANMPYNLLGAPGDIANLLAAPTGRQPFYGSEAVKDFATRMGVRPPPPTDPTQAFLYGAGDIGSALVNPAAPVRAAARGAQAVGEGLSAAAKDFQAYNQALSVPGASYAVKPGAAKDPIYQPLPTAEAPFVGRVDQFVAALPGPVRKDQLLGQLSNKFREYEVGRAREALQDLDDAEKIAPVEVLNRLRGQYNPSYYRTVTVEPKTKEFFSGMDNPFGRDKPLGVFHLVEDVLPEAGAKQERFTKLFDEVQTSTYGTVAKNPQELAEQWTKIQNLMEGSSTRVKGVFDEYEKIHTLKREVGDLEGAIQYPSLSPQWQEYTAQAIQNLKSAGSDQELDFNKVGLLARRYAAAEALTKLKSDYGYRGLEPFLNNLTRFETRDRKEIGKLFDELDLVFRANREPINNRLQNQSSLLREAINNNVTETKPYYGQHSSLSGQQNIVNPIAFSRFSEHEVEIPGMGRVPGVYVHELQSDRLDDLRKRGSVKSSPQTDLDRKIIPLLDQQRQISADIVRYREEGNSSEARAQLKKLNDINKKMRNVELRMAEGQYDMREAFSGMEESPQVIQQLMVKNAISAAMNRGARFVAFPGKESAQAQLYENLPNNLKQVVKDFGPGFEVRSVVLTDKDGQEFMSPAVVWGEEGVAKVRKQGIPFAHGGEVNKHDDFIAQNMQAGGEARSSDRGPGLFGVREYATKRAAEMFPNQKGQDDQRDAARHMLAAGLVAQQYGPRAADLLGKAHEYTSNPRTLFSAVGLGEARDDLPYDLHNNQLGVELAARTKSREELEALVQSLAKQSSFEQKPGLPWVMGPEAIQQRKERALREAKMLTERPQYNKGGVVAK